MQKKVILNYGLASSADLCHDVDYTPDIRS